ncbi:polygalacturonase 1 beta-like protein 1 [Gastrolobium bilobum]|uniref:polygalacturonase 1 beta-like protein 1 n=1 Tax=Gastrolobium bilobum TaxID=150636 RepID=UPI002AAF4C45|nr:polygalacturonase 1 beta-like protein 1 [Gastrolobium bilobum]
MSIHFICLFLSLSYFHVSLATNGIHQTEHYSKQINPFSPKASLIRYWNTHVSNKHPIPHFLLSKASPLTPQHYAILNNLITHKPFSPQFHNSLCSTPNFYCSFDDTLHNPTTTTTTTMTKGDANFALYSNKRFANYGSSRVGGVDSFKNYSDGLNTNNDSFKKYSTTSTRHGGEFKNYAENGNVANTNFTSYGSGANSGSGDFDNYDKLVNVPNLGFTTYDSAANNHKLSFSSYGNETNSGTQSFASYGKRVRGGTSDFNNYADSSNILQSQFTSYGELGAGTNNDSFKSYSFNGNNPRASFKTYGAGSVAGTDSFVSYRNRANVGDDSFQSYAAKSNSGAATFANYGQSFNVGNDTFTEYGKGSSGRTSFGFKSYGLGRAFKEYTKQGASFSEYHNFSGFSGKAVNKWVEPGKYFRESMLKEGNVVTMPDIRDKMPARSFLPLAISSKLPFSSSRMREMKEVFHAREGSAIERVIVNALGECEREPSRGETKRCVGSAEGMIEFAVSVLGANVMVRATENVNGWGTSVMIGRVYAMDGGKVTKSVSCHQSLYPYLLYYCHSVPEVRVYEADILDVETKVKINHGVAICHLDTSSWGKEHGAFLALGSGPGKIEVCHWIFQNDMTWTTAN